jgi:rubrerythrin
MKRADWTRHLFDIDQRARDSVLDLLRHRYVREKQHAMRYRQHAERIRREFRDTLISMAVEEERHAASIGAKIIDLGEKLPDVIPIHVAQEANSWSYLRTDLEEEQRCAGEMSNLPDISGKFSEIAELLAGIDSDSERHRTMLRDMLARSVPQPLGI